MPPEPTATTAEPEPTTAPATREQEADAALAQAFGGETGAEPGAAAEPDDEDLPAAEAAEAPPPPAEPEAPWTVQQARRYRRQADRRLAEAQTREQAASSQAQRLEAQLATLEARDAKLRDLETALDRDPEAALTALATRAGLDPEQWYERLTIRRANGGAPGGGELQTRIERLEAQLTAERQERATREQQARQQSQAQSEEAELHEATTRMVAIRENEVMARRWPHAASLPPAELYARARVELAHRLRTTQGPVVLDQIVDAIEAEAKPLVETLRTSKWLQQQAAAPPPPVPPASGRRTRSPAARDATGAGGPRELSRADREAAADALLAKAFGRDT